MVSPKIPDKIGRYRITHKIGHGGMGVVYVGHDPFIDRQVAVKIMLAAPSKDSSDLDRYQQLFFNEARAAGKLTHPHIVPVYDAMWERDMGYLIMEYVEGTTLEKHCSKKSLLPIDNITKYIFQSAKALDYAHQNGVVHRDIKPSNIIISLADETKITDFGIAQVEGFADLSDSGSFTGSVYYTSPEQTRNEPLTPQTDLFSLGVVMYELLTGAKPFQAANEYAILYKIMHENPAPLEKYRQDIPKALERIVMQALAKDLTERYQTGRQLASELVASFDKLRFLDAALNPQEKLNALKKITFFKDFSSSELAEVLKTAQWLKYKAAETIITEGEIEDCFYIIVAGEVVVTKKRKQLAVLKQGDCFGEMAYLSKRKRTATIKTISNTILMKINASIIEQMSTSAQFRFYKVFSHTLIQRLSRTSELLTQKSFWPGLLRRVSRKRLKKPPTI